MAQLNIDKKKLKKYMEENNLTEQNLADKIGLDYTMVYRVLRDERNPGPKFVAGVLRNTDLDFDDIFFTNNLPKGRKEENSA